MSGNFDLMIYLLLTEKTIVMLILDVQDELLRPRFQKFGQTSQSGDRNDSPQPYRKNEKAKLITQNSRSRKNRVSLTLGFKVVDV